MKVDYAIIGGGLVGLSTAYHLLTSKPGASLIVLEKEAQVATHQSTRNSGVIHTGIYYKPGSYKARLCVEGRKALLAFAEQHSVTHSICGKVIVATRESQREQLNTLHSRANANGVKAALLTPEGIREREPHVTGVAGLWVPDSGVIDFAGLARALVQEIKRLGGEVLTAATVQAATRGGDGWLIEGTFDRLVARYVVNCAGLHCDRVARMFGERTAGRIVPFRGEYYVLRDEARTLCRTLIYPVPDPRFPFLGVHFTRRYDGSVECGPNAVLALAREGYSWGDISPRDLFRMARFGGFRRLIAKHWKMGVGEMYRSLFKSAFLRALQELVPEVKAEDLLPGGAGVRAQFVRPDGSLEEDFAFKQSPDVLHVLNAPSPAATSCLSIGAEIARRALHGNENHEA